MLNKVIKMIKIILIYISFLSFAISASVTFNIDMSDFDFPNDNYDNVVINGEWDNWNGWGVTLNDDDNDGIYSGILNIDQGTYQYVIALTGVEDNWSGWGQTINAPTGSFCDLNPEDEWANYGFTVSSNSNLIESYCAGTCLDTCNENSGGGNSGENNNENDGYVLVWSDEFNNSEIDQSKWNFEIGNGNWGWGNGEHQYYRQENAFIEDGKLIIEARNENFGGFQYTSTRMQTRDKADFLYGKISANIKVPSAGGTWPAFWLMPTNSVYGGWPDSGEIDIMEHYGCIPNDVSATVHNNMYNWNGGIPPTSYHHDTTAIDDFHIYEVEWTEDELKFYVDEVYIGTYFRTNSGSQQWPYDQEFYIILNLAIGSHFMSCETEDNLFPQRYEIDYVRVYQYQECLGGDFSNDGQIDVIDVVQLVDYILYPDSNNELNNNCADVDQNGLINIVDVVLLVELIIN